MAEEIENTNTSPAIPTQPLIPGFRFKVVTITEDDKTDSKAIEKNSFASFQSISRINAKIKTEKVALLGSNNRQLHVHNGVEFDDVVFKKGILSGDINLSEPFLSGIVNMSKDKYRVQKMDLIVVALDQKDNPAYAVKLKRCFPTAWEMGEFNAETGQLLIESVTYSVGRIEEVSI
ncbi:phage tail protein [Flammeovirga sp. MY04]|uniref:phage tail protein n=1 Tax=Flammeovirga sp. MY04 TaxID=1191459 RepID=UPI0008062D43|nr:phage tail protein [Flammeovirga sp. MY04]ANQ52259.1 phage tail protein [Flammeovirga sp. MY04]